MRQAKQQLHPDRFLFQNPDLQITDTPDGTLGMLRYEQINRMTADSGILCTIDTVQTFNLDLAAQRNHGRVHSQCIACCRGCACCCLAGIAAVADRTGAIRRDLESTQADPCTGGTGG